MRVLAILLTLMGISPGDDVRYFPSILYGHILVGSGSSRYNTTFVVTAKKDTRASLILFTDGGEPMKARFVDEAGNIANSGDSFDFWLSGGRPIQLRLELTEEDEKEQVVVKTGWATLRSLEEIDVTAIVRITTPDGKIITRHVLSSEKPPTG